MGSREFSCLTSKGPIAGVEFFGGGSSYPLPTSKTARESGGAL